MEKIKVLSIKPVDGKKFWSAELEDGRRVTVWPGNDGNLNLIKSIQQNLNVDCEAVLKPFGDNGFNLRAFSVTPQGEKQEEIKPAAERKSVKGTAYEKDPVGLAVELMCAGHKAQEAIDAVKLAQKAFN